MIIIDKEKCTGCRLCTVDCPAGALTMKDGKADYVKDCIHCGHCVAICHTGAVSIPSYDMADVEEYNSETFSVCPSCFLHTVKFRRSVRNYKNQPVEHEKLERILCAGRYTPTAKNAQACTFAVVADGMEEWREFAWKSMPDVIESFREESPHYAKTFEGFCRKRQQEPSRDKLFFNAPVFLAIAADNPLDAGLAAANIENMAVAEGLGALYTAYTQRLLNHSPACREWLGLGDRHVACCMLLGYPAVKYWRTAPRKKADIIWR